MVDEWARKPVGGTGLMLTVKVNTCGRCPFMHVLGTNGLAYCTYEERNQRVKVVGPPPSDCPLRSGPVVIKVQLS